MAASEQDVLRALDRLNKNVTKRLDRQDEALERIERRIGENSRRLARLERVRFLRAVLR